MKTCARAIFSIDQRKKRKEYNEATIFEKQNLHLENEKSTEVIDFSAISIEIRSPTPSFNRGKKCASFVASFTKQKDEKQWIKRTVSISNNKLYTHTHSIQSIEICFVYLPTFILFVFGNHSILRARAERRERKRKEKKVKQANKPAQKTPISFYRLLLLCYFSFFFRLLLVLRLQLLLLMNCSLNYFWVYSSRSTSLLETHTVREKKRPQNCWNYVQKCVSSAINFIFSFRSVLSFDCVSLCCFHLSDFDGEMMMTFAFSIMRSADARCTVWNDDVYVWWPLWNMLITQMKWIEMEILWNRSSGIVFNCNETERMLEFKYAVRSFQICSRNELQQQLKIRNEFDRSKIVYGFLLCQFVAMRIAVVKTFPIWSIVIVWTKCTFKLAQSQSKVITRNHRCWSAADDDDVDG